MASVGTFLHFHGEAEAAFTFYKSVFGAEFTGDISRYGDLPPTEDAPEITEDDKGLVMHVGLSITGGHLLMGSDVPSAMGGDGLVKGNNVNICLMPDTRTEADRLFAALSEGGSVEMAMADMFWGDYFGSLTDRFGIQWMITVQSKD